MIHQLHENFLIPISDKETEKLKQADEVGSRLYQLASKGKEQQFFKALEADLELGRPALRHSDFETVSPAFRDYVLSSSGVEAVKGPFELLGIPRTYARIPDAEAVAPAPEFGGVPFPGIVVGGDRLGADFIMLIGGDAEFDGLVLTYDYDDLEKALDVAQTSAKTALKSAKKKEGGFYYFFRALAENSAQFNLRRLVILQAELHVRTDEKINKTDMERLVLKIFKKGTEHRNLNRVRHHMELPDFKFLERYRKAHNARVRDR